MKAASVTPSHPPQPSTQSSYINQSVRGVTVICSPHPGYGDVVAPLTCVHTPGGSLVKLGRKVTLLSSFKYLTSTLQSKHVDICRFV